MTQRVSVVRKGERERLAEWLEAWAETFSEPRARMSRLHPKSLLRAASLLRSGKGEVSKKDSADLLLGRMVRSMEPNRKLERIMTMAGDIWYADGGEQDGPVPNGPTPEAALKAALKPPKGRKGKS